jgi:hypothetical protein
MTYEPDGHGDYALAWYDATAKEYRQWFFNGTGGYAFELRGTWDDAQKALTWKSPDGRLEGSWTFKGDDVREFRHLIKGPDGKVLSDASGVSRRVAAGLAGPAPRPTDTGGKD